MSIPYAGIDYSHGRSNVDKDTGIRYGVISQRSVHPEVADDIVFGPHSTDLGYMTWQAELEQAVERGVLDALRPILTETAAQRLAAYLASQVEDYDSLGDWYHSDAIEFRYEWEGYVIQKCLDTDFFVIKSPYFTHAQYCSPCVPGAGDLDHPCPDGVKCYCLGPEFFEKDQAPYPVFQVSTGELL